MNKRLALLLLVALPLFAAPPDKWYESYKRGVAAVNARNYKAAESALHAAIVEAPNEGVGVRTRNEIVTYVPHFWMGIAKFNLGEVDAALREFRISEEQGAIARTEYYSLMKEWVARAQTEKKRMAQNASSGAKTAAGAAINAAVLAQSGAVSAGGDHTESYRSGSRKLQEALAALPRAGTDIEAYQRVEETAKQARALFGAAAEEAKKQKAARAAAPKPKPAAPPAIVPKVEIAQTQPAAPAPVKVEPKVEAPPPAPVVTAAETNARLAVQQYRRKLMDAASTKPRDKEFQSFVRRERKGSDELQRQLDAAKSDADFERIAKIVINGEERLSKRIEELTVTPAALTASVLAPRSSEELRGTRGTEDTLRSAYREFAAGNLASSEDILSKLIDRKPTGEALLLRGCARYTRAMLSREPDSLLTAASEDFKAALSQNRSLRLDERAFSPKLVAFFEKVRNGS
jgi:tetratricopeptide (TPR) repeat protein